jgi:hypothetical protein
MAMAYFGWASAIGLSLSLMSCVAPAGAQRIIGPDGTPMLHVHCEGEQVACFQIAGERCPRGYDLSPIFDPHDGNFLVRCREPERPVVIVTRGTLAPRPAQTNSAAATAANPWPPAEVATPTEPWPAPSASALPSTPRAATSAVDIGY